VNQCPGYKPCPGHNPCFGYFVCPCWSKSQRRLGQSAPASPPSTSKTDSTHTAPSGRIVYLSGMTYESINPRNRIPISKHAASLNSNAESFHAPALPVYPTLFQISLLVGHATVQERQVPVLNGSSASNQASHLEPRRGLAAKLYAAISCTGNRSAASWARYPEDLVSFAIGSE
jgi:hypothetical protein